MNKHKCYAALCAPNQKLAHAGKPLIGFTTKAQVFLLPTPEQDKSSFIQKANLADVDIVEVTNIRKNGVEIKR